MDTQGNRKDGETDLNNRDPIDWAIAAEVIGGASLLLTLEELR